MSVFIVINWRIFPLGLQLTSELTTIVMHQGPGRFLNFFVSRLRRLEGICNLLFGLNPIVIYWHLYMQSHIVSLLSCVSLCAGTPVIVFSDS